MGRRSASCFRIVSCAADQDEPAAASTESKRSTDKRGWSFHKRSARPKVPSNPLSSDTPSSGHKGSPESEAITFKAAHNCNVPEKITLFQRMDEKPPLSSVNTDTSDSVERDIKFASSLDESIIVVTQACIRSFLELSKLKSIVKLQGAVRGHLVRRHAVGTLFCIKAIIKMQILFRARQNLAPLERSYMADAVMPNHKKVSEKAQENGAIARPEVAYLSFQNLRSNGFAHKLLELVRKTSHFNFKCDLSNPNAAWIWMERWTSVASPNIVESREQKFRLYQVENGTANDSLHPRKNDFASDVNEPQCDTC